MRSLLALGLFLPAIVFACGDSTSSAQPDVPSDAATDAGSDLDAGSQDEADPTPSSTYPAPHPAVPLLTYGGAPLIKAARIVSVTFEGDPSRPLINGFDDDIGGTQYWTDTTSTYCEGDGSTACIGPATNAGHVTLPVTTTSFSSADIETLVQSNVTSGIFPPPTPDTIYALHFPSTMTVGDPGFESCQVFDGYHSQMSVTPPAPSNPGDGGTDEAGAGEAGTDGGDDGGPDASLPPVLAQYAVTVECTDDNELTVTAAHEYIETVTDPAGRGYTMPDQAWASTLLSEVGDLCDLETPIIEDSYTVQRIWSNVSAKAGHNPCIPLALGEVYFASAPIKGSVTLAVGESTTIDVQSWSDAPTGDWTIDAADWGKITHTATASLDVSLDRTQVNNGIGAKVKVTLAARPPQTDFNPQGLALYAITATQGSVTHYWPAMVIPK